MLGVDGEHVEGAALHRLVEEVCRGEHRQRSHSQTFHRTVKSELDKQSFVHVYEHFLQQLGVLKHGKTMLEMEKSTSRLTVKVL